MIIEWGSLYWIGAVLAVIGLIFAIGNWYGAVNADRKSFKEFMKEVRDDIKEILKRMPEPSPVQSKSPIQLTDFGEDISNTISAVNWAVNEAKNLIDNARGKEEFEIFELYVSYVSKKFDTDSEFRKSVKANAYQIGTSEENVLKVYQVVLRNNLLDQV